MKEIQKFTLILFRHPDGRVILQRRTKDAPYGAGLLCMFGGWVEKGETVDKSLLREIQEETSLDIKTLQPKLISDFIIKAGEDFGQDRHFYFYEALVADVDFEVYEGVGAEVFSIDEIKDRSDLTGSTHYAFSNFI